MAENAGGTTVAAPVDNSPSLTSVIGEMFGDYRDAEPETEAGAPLPESPDTGSSSADDSEGTAASEPAGTPPAEADLTSVPDSTTPTDTPDLDPFEGSTPLAYTVDGEARSYDGITVLKDGGAIIDPSALEKVQRVFGERDHLFEQGQRRHEQYTSLERLTKWDLRNENGETRTLTGREGLETQRAILARSLATQTVLDSVLTDPETLAAIVDIKQDAEGNIYIVPNPREVANLRTKADNAAMRAEQKARAHFATLAAPEPTPEAPVESLAGVTIDAIAKTNAIALTDADKQWAAQHFPRYVISTKDGRAVDPTFIDLLKDRAQLRADSMKTVAVASAATQTNAAKLAAASLGRGKPTNAPKITPPKTPEPSRDNDFDDLWDRQEKAAAGALKAHAIGR